MDPASIDVVGVEALPWHTLLLLAVETGMRVSELTGLTCDASQLGTGHG